MVENNRCTRRISSIVESSNEPRKRLETYKDLYKLFLQDSERLCSDGVIEENGTIRVSTTTGGTMTSDNVISALEQRDEERAHRRQTVQHNQVIRQQRAEERRLAQEQAEQRREERIRRADEREETALQTVKQSRLTRREAMASSRRSRRERAREAALKANPNLPLRLAELANESSCL